VGNKHESRQLRTRYQLGMVVGAADLSQGRLRIRIGVAEEPQ
jgi:hypothetical protein